MDVGKDDMEATTQEVKDTKCIKLKVVGQGPKDVGEVFEDLFDGGSFKKGRN